MAVSKHLILIDRAELEDLKSPSRAGADVLLHVEKAHLVNFCPPSPVII